MSWFAAVRARAGSRRLRRAFELLFLVGALATALPLFVARYVPIQDLPQHVAAVRVLADYGAPELGFSRFFELSLASTQYLSVYLLAALLEPVVGALLAVKLVLALALVALPYSLRAVLRALRRPESYALLALPLAYNVHLVLGFVNFVAALPLLFFGVALALRLRARWTRARFVQAALVALACFYTHVVPYGVLVVASVLIAARRDVTRALRSVAALAPSLVAAGVWGLANPAGRAVVALATGGGAVEPPPRFLTAGEALRDLPEWFTDVFREGDEDRAFALWLGLLVTLFVSAAARPRTTALPELDAMRLRVAWLVPLTFAGYWLAPESYGFMWPIHGRFAFVALLLAIVAVPRIGRAWRAGLAVGSLALAASTTLTATRAFQAVAEHEYAGLDRVIARVPEGSRVAGLIFSPQSRFVRYAPFLHAVAWVQAERGGAVQFTFANFPSSPFRFRRDDRPPEVPPRWEWRPDLVDPERDLGWFDYVLTRGGRPVLDGFQRLARDGAWSLWGRSPRDRDAPSASR